MMKDYDDYKDDLNPASENSEEEQEQEKTGWIIPFLIEKLSLIYSYQHC